MMASFPKPMPPLEAQLFCNKLLQVYKYYISEKQISNKVVSFAEHDKEVVAHPAPVSADKTSLHCRLSPTHTTYLPFANF
jgi:hypothetical protein